METTPLSLPLEFVVNKANDHTGLPILKADLPAFKVDTIEDAVTFARIERPAVPTPCAFAKVLPLLEVPQLDKLFDYRIPPEMVVQPGQLVSVRFHGRKINAIVYEIVEKSEFTGRIANIEKVISEGILLDDNMRVLVERIALRYVGTRPEVIRLVLPTRHAAAEKQFFAQNPQFLNDDPQFSKDDYLAAPNYQYSHLCTAQERETEDYRILERMLHMSHLSHVTEKIAEGKSWKQENSVTEISLADSRVMWILHPEQAWMEKILLALKICLAQSRKAIVIVPSMTRGQLLEKFLKKELAEFQIRFFHSGQGGKKIYTNWLEVKYGLVDIVIGMRSAIYVPYSQVGLIIMFNEGDDLYAEPLAPYPHTRVNAMLRSLIEHCALLIIGYSRSAEVQALCNSNWARSYISPVQADKSQAITVRALSNEKAEDPFFALQRIPSEVFTLSRESLLQNKPVLIHVHLKGYSDTIICHDCHGIMRCRTCNGTLYQKNQHTVFCHSCHKESGNLCCITCGSRRMRYIKAGAKRTAQELSQAFAEYEVIYSADDNIQRSIKHGAKLIIATAGAEPEVSGGYATVIYLDILASMFLDDLRAEEKVFRNIMNCMSLVAPAGRFFLAADIAFPVIREAVRKDAEKFAQIELAKRTEVHFPPMMRIATIDGQIQSIERFLTLCTLPDATEILGPISLLYGVDSLNEATFGARENAERVLLRVPFSQAHNLSIALGKARRAFGTQHNHFPVRIMIDPWKIS